MPKGTHGRSVCSVDGCEQPMKARGWCNTHYARWRLRGTVETRTVDIRFWEKVDKRGPDECWLWTAARGPGGYGFFTRGRGHSPLVHRFAYELLVGPIPEGLTIDHLCRTKLCVNPAHLEPVSNAENVRRANRGKSHCKYGHPFDDENTLIYLGNRVCRTCTRRRRAEWWRRRQGIKPR